MIYLDNAATTMPKPAAVYTAVLNAMTTCASLGRSGHQLAQNASELAIQCREAAAELFDLDPESVVFTFNATHGLNLAIQTLVKPEDEVVISGFEHNAVLRPLYHLGAKIKIAGQKLFDPADTVEAFRRMITPQTKAVICTHVSNVFGYILPIEKIAGICKERELPLIIDASQSAGILPVSMAATDAAFIAMPGHKGLLGPQGTGLLLCRNPPKPLLQGGTGSLSHMYEMPEYLPDCAEPGTHNVPGIAGLLEGIKYIRNTGMTAIQAHETELIRSLCGKMTDIPGLRLFSDAQQFQTGVLSFHADNMDCEQLADELSKRGAAVRAGMHCAPLAHKSAGTFRFGTIRVSVSPFNTKEDILQFSDIVREVLCKGFS